ncbi:uncharacterized protein LOC113316108 [Papaver somniferum]|uniref:uncharacterized protein LOC113316108 n=1 Tax=Papaver somniferum TaxID=3469 RepID=UPI000E6F737C|nr:uncharacterized protein LOC113316108 [Papaver somniferum]
MAAMMRKIATIVVPTSPQLYEKCNDQVNVIFPNQQRQQYNPYYITYNPRWRDHPSFNYANKQVAVPRPVFNRPSVFQQQQQPQQQIESSGDSGKLPSQPLNPRENFNVLLFRSDTQTVQPEDVEKNKDPKGSVLDKEITDSSQIDQIPKGNSKTLGSSYVPPVPFLRMFANSKKAEQDKEILDTFKKIHVNIPLVDAIKQVPKYVRILKDLCTNKQRLTGNEVIKVWENASAILQKKLPLKCKDPGRFDIPIVIGNTKFNKAMLDLGVSVNVMPAYIYESLNLGPLK